MRNPCGIANLWHSQDIFCLKTLAMHWVGWTSAPLKVPKDPSRLRRDTLAVGLRDLELGLQAECWSWINPEAIVAVVPMTFKRSPSMNPGRDYWDYWVLVGGLEHLDYFSIDWEFHHPNWRTPSFFRGVGQPPTRVSLNSILFLHSCAEWRLATLWKQGWKGVRFRTSHGYGDWAKSVLVQLNQYLVDPPLAELTCGVSSETKLMIVAFL